MSKQMTMFGKPTMKAKPADEAIDEAQRLATQIVSARARYAYNKDIRDDPTMPATRRQRARRNMRTTGKRIIRLVSERKALINDNRLLSHQANAAQHLRRLSHPPQV